MTVVQYHGLKIKAVEQGAVSTKMEINKSSKV